MNPIWELTRTSSVKSWNFRLSKAFRRLFCICFLFLSFSTHYFTERGEERKGKEEGGKVFFLFLLPWLDGYCPSKYTLQVMLSKVSNWFQTGFKHHFGGPVNPWTWELTRTSSVKSWNFRFSKEVFSVYVFLVLYS